MKSIALRAYGKLNLTLEVLGRRPDGYHEVATVLQTVSAFDVLTVRLAGPLSLRCSDRSLEGEDNLVYRAAIALQEASGSSRGAEITLEKGIPIAGGMGGGSADAAAALVALNKLWSLGLSDAALSEIAAEIGSDVPFSLEGGTALATGRGERITRLPAPPPASRGWFLVVRPPVDIPRKTATAYSLVQPAHWTAGKASQQLAESLRRGEPIREADLYNVFDHVVPEAYPEVDRWRRLLLEAGPSRPHLTGAGPSLYVPVADQAEGQKLRSALPKEAGVISLVVCTMPRSIEFLDK